MVRVARRRGEIEADRPIRLACLGNARFVTVLPIDEGLKPSDEVPTFVPYPGYSVAHGEPMPNQLAEYLGNAFLMAMIWIWWPSMRGSGLVV